jgi:hypothetical protein
VESVSEELIKSLIQQIDASDKIVMKKHYDELMTYIENFEEGRLGIKDAERKYSDFLQLREKYKGKQFDEIYDEYADGKIYNGVMKNLSTNSELKTLLKDVFAADLGIEPVSIFPKSLKFWGGSKKEIDSLDLPEGYGSSLVLTNIIILRFNNTNNGYRYIIPSPHTVMSVNNIVGRIKNTRHNRISNRNKTKRRTI